MNAASVTVWWSWNEKQNRGYTRIEAYFSCPLCGVILGPMSLSEGESRKCCFRHDAVHHWKHGLTSASNPHPLYEIWGSIKKRCYDPNCEAWINYGARGITVCEEWLHDPAAFVGWCIVNGWKRNLTVDRRDNSGNYTPENVRFVTRDVQNRNKRNNVLNESAVRQIKRKLIDGESALEIAPQFGITRNYVYDIKLGRAWANVHA